MGRQSDAAGTARRHVPGDSPGRRHYTTDMSDAARKLRSILVDLPEEAFHVHPWAPEEIAGDLRTLWLLELVRQRRLGHGKAAELAGIARARFLQLLGQHGISAFDYDVEELEAELG